MHERNPQLALYPAQQHPKNTSSNIKEYYKTYHAPKTQKWHYSNFDLHPIRPRNTKRKRNLKASKPDKMQLIELRYPVPHSNMDPLPNKSSIKPVMTQ